MSPRLTSSSPRLTPLKIDIMIMSLLDDPDAKRRKDIALNIIYGFEDYNHDEIIVNKVVSNIVRALQKEVVDEVRSVLILGLGKIKGHMVNVLPLLKEILLTDENPDIRLATVTAIAQFNDTSVIDPIQNAFHNDESLRVRQQAELALIAISERFSSHFHI